MTSEDSSKLPGWATETGIRPDVKDVNLRLGRESGDRVGALYVVCLQKRRAAGQQKDWIYDPIGRCKSCAALRALLADWSRDAEGTIKRKIRKHKIENINGEWVMQLSDNRRIPLMDGSLGMLHNKSLPRPPRPPRPKTLKGRCQVGKLIEAPARRFDVFRDQSFPGKLTFDDWSSIEEVVRSGLLPAFSANWYASQHTVQNGMKRYIVKKIETFPQKLKNELDLMRRSASHPNILSVVGWNEEDRYIVYESFEGCLNLEQMRHGILNGTICLPDIIGIAAGLIAAVKHMHDHGKVHSDIKPSKVLVRYGDQGMEVKVAGTGYAFDIAAQGQHRHQLKTADDIWPADDRGIVDSEYQTKPIDATLDLYQIGYIIQSLLYMLTTSGVNGIVRLSAANAAMDIIKLREIACRLVAARWMQNSYDDFIEIHSCMQKMAEQNSTVQFAELEDMY